MLEKAENLFYKQLEEEILFHSMVLVITLPTQVGGDFVFLSEKIKQMVSGLGWGTYNAL